MDEFDDWPISEEEIKKYGFIVNDVQQIKPRKVSNMAIPITMFGKDHWSTFGYVECRCVDNQGRLEHMHLRKDGVKYPTMLKGWTKEKPVEAANHSDIDCLDDLEYAGLLENTGTGFSRVYKLTPRGFKVAAQLREHKAKGGSFSNFEVASV